MHVTTRIGRARALVVGVTLILGTLAAAVPSSAATVQPFANVHKSFVTRLEASSPPPCACTNNVYNPSTITIGVIHVEHSVYNTYRLGLYDALLSPNETTYGQFGWLTTAGFYTGPGYCTSVWRSDNGGPWTRQLPDLGPGQHFIGPHTTYFIRPYQDSNYLIDCPSII